MPMQLPWHIQAGCACIVVASPVAMYAIDPTDHAATQAFWGALTGLIVIVSTMLQTWHRNRQTEQVKKILKDEAAVILAQAEKAAAELICTAQAAAAAAAAAA